MSAPVDLLRNVPLFQGLSQKELKQLADNFTQRTFREGTELTAEGQGGVGFFVIESGEAIVTVEGLERRRLGPGDYFGEIALVDGGLRTATITAVSDGASYGLTPWQFRPLVESNASIAWPLLEAMARRTRELESQLQAQQSPA
jgi:CRP/FNR family transcriptional regulator, cyclic AMP receptor protein